MLKARRGEYDSAMTDAKECLRLSGGLPDLRPGERKEVNEVNFHCIRLYGDLKEVGATPKKLSFIVEQGCWYFSHDGKKMP